MMNYTEGLFIDLYCQFYKELMERDYLIVSGYSFGDRGINYRIFEWLNYKPKNKIIIIDPLFQSLKISSRGAIFNQWDGWIEQEKIVEVKKGIENTKWAEIKEFKIKF